MRENNFVVQICVDTLIAVIDFYSEILHLQTAILFDLELKEAFRLTLNNQIESPICLH